MNGEIEDKNRTCVVIATERNCLVNCEEETDKREFFLPKF